MRVDVVVSVTFANCTQEWTTKVQSGKHAVCSAAAATNDTLTTNNYVASILFVRLLPTALGSTEKTM